MGSSSFSIGTCTDSTGEIAAEVTIVTRYGKMLEREQQDDGENENGDEDTDIYA